MVSTREKMTPDSINEAVEPVIFEAIKDTTDITVIKTIQNIIVIEKIMNIIDQNTPLLP
jgi:hypothetical protein